MTKGISKLNNEILEKDKKIKKLHVDLKKATDNKTKELAARVEELKLLGAEVARLRQDHQKIMDRQAKSIAELAG